MILTLEAARRAVLDPGLRLTWDELSGNLPRNDLAVWL